MMVHQQEVEGVWDLPARLKLSAEIAWVRDAIGEVVQGSDPEVREMLDRQLAAGAKYFRPVTLLACHRATTDTPPPETVLRAAVAVELVHNVTLIVDDILDRSRYRRGKLSLHCRFGSLPALMAAGYLNAEATRLVADDAYSVRVLGALFQRLAVAECLQWRLRREPLGVEDWRAIAREDTGSMFETCAVLGTQDDRLRRFGQVLGILYHGCDDVADVRGTAALGGGSHEDISDGILTLPAALAIRDPNTAQLFRTATPDAAPELAAKLRDALAAAEETLDGIAHEAEDAARRADVTSHGLRDLIRHTRALAGA